MSKRIEQFPFYIHYGDIDTYCFWLADTYKLREDSALIKAIDDSGLLEQSDNPQIYRKNADTILMELRQYLINHGFEKEVIACDKAFAEERNDRGMENRYSALHRQLKTKNKNN